MIFDSISWLDWQVALDHADRKADKFAWTFRAKADAMSLWDDAVGFFTTPDRTLAAGIIVRVNKREPVANLQLLHTFARFRRQGLARRLVEHEFGALPAKVQYFRVSAEEDAVPFYRSIGFKFWGAQKSGSLLSIFRINGPTIANGIYDPDDPIISKAIFKRGRGGLVEHFKEGAC